MGLDTTHDAWHGGYGAFSRWREHLALAAGYEVADLVVEKIEIPGRPVYKSTRSTILIDWGHIKPENYAGTWATEDEPRDPLIYLFAHSDCDGYLTARHAGLIADRLEELLPVLADEIVSGQVGNLRSKTQEFIDGCRAAHAAGEPLEFM